MTVAALIRCSTTSQDVASQREAVSRWTERTGRVIEMFDEGSGVSGALTETQRPNLGWMMDRARDGHFDAVVVTEVSRLGRDALETMRLVLELHALDVPLFVLALDDERPTDVTSSDAFLRMALEVYLAAKEREKTGERTSRGLDGWDLNGARVPPGTPGARRVAVRSGKPVGRRGHVWPAETDEALRSFAAAGRSAPWIAQHGCLSVIAVRDVDAEGRLCYLSKQPAVTTREVRVAPGEAAIRRRMEELPRSA